MQILGMLCIIEVFFSETFLFVGMCRFAGTFATDLDVNLKDIGDQLLAEEGKLNSAKRIKVMKKFKDLIKFQSNSKE